MARETALWDRCKRGGKAIRQQGHKLDMQRVENCAVSGHPDVEGCLDGGQFWIELKTCLRPARADTVIRPKKRESQEIWHEERSRAGGTIHWILIQVGEDKAGKLYLIPGCRYAEITATEAKLAEMSVLPHTATTADVILRAVTGW